MGEKHGPVSEQEALKMAVKANTGNNALGVLPDGFDLTREAVRKDETKADKTVLLKPHLKGLFKYYQMKVEAGIKIRGEVFLNGVSVNKLSGSGGTTSRDVSLILAKKGRNVIRLKISSSFSKAALHITLNAVDEDGFVNEDNAIITIAWRSKGNKPETIDYVFILKAPGS